MSTDESNFQKGEWFEGQFYPAEGDDQDEMPPSPRQEIPAADRQLLELAARALGAVRFDEVDGEGYANLYFDNAPPMYGWNPLQFGDDAFILAARLNLMRNNPTFQRHLSVEQDKGGDPIQSAKRAVVLAAAEIGKAMQ